MNRKERRAAGVKVARPALRDLVTSLCLAAPWIIRTRWPPQHAHSLEMSFAAREVLRRFQYGSEMASCVLVVGNGSTTVCLGNDRAGYDLLARRGDLGRQPPSFEDWRSQMRFAADRNGGHVVLKARSETARAFADLTFGHAAIATGGALQVPPAFAGFGEIEWPSLQMGNVWFHYAPMPDLPEMHAITVDEWSGLIDDFEMLVEIAIGFENDERAFVTEMQRQMQEIGR